MLIWTIDTLSFDKIVTHYDSYCLIIQLSKMYFLLEKDFLLLYMRIMHLVSFSFPVTDKKY